MTKLAGFTETTWSRIAYRKRIPITSRHLRTVEAPRGFQCAILGVTLRSLEKTAPDLEDEVQALVLAMGLVSDISHRIDPVGPTNPPGAPAVTSARQARKEAAHG